MRKILTCVIIGFCFLLAQAKAYPIEAIEVFSGYFTAELKNNDDYQGIPLLVSFDFDAKPFFQKLGLNSKGKLSFIAEPFVNTVISPDPNAEVGSNFLFKYTFPLSEKVQPYFKTGLGFLYMSQHTVEQGGQFNFLPQVGTGLHIFLKPELALSFEYRYRHISNNGLDDPNGGIETNMFLGGISLFFS